MKILVIGATGMAGEAVVSEAVKRGYEVIANARNEEKLQKLQDRYPQITIYPRDAFDLTYDDLVGVDGVVDAFATKPDLAYLHVDLAGRLVHLVRNQKRPRLAFILGAGSLRTGDHFLVDEIKKDSTTLSWREVPIQQMNELVFLQLINNVDWFGISPGQSFVAGPKSEVILTGSDELLVNKQGKSVTTAGTMASVLLDQLISPSVHQRRITIANG